MWFILLVILVIAVNIYFIGKNDGYYEGYNDCKRKTKMFKEEETQYCENCLKLQKENEELKTHCKYIDVTNRILDQEKVDLLEKNKDLEDANSGLCRHVSHITRLKDKAEQKLEKIKELISLDDINCIIPKDIQGLFDEILKIIKDK